MRKLWYTGVLFAIMLIIVPAMAVTLYAGQDIPVGEVTYIGGPDTLKITYMTTGGWEMIETHLAVADAPDKIPQKNGNPIPGKFEFSTVHDYPVTEFTYIVDLTRWPAGTELYIAAHAAVVHTVRGSMDVVSSTNTRVIEVNGQAVTQPQYAVAANEPFNYPNCRDYTPDDTSKSWWDEGIGDSYGYFAGTPADWIWNTPGPVQPITGDVVKFQEKFTIPGYPMIGFLFITADNGFEAVLNGERVGSRQIGPGFPDTLREQVGTDTLPQTGDWGVAANGWQSVGDYSLTGLVIGENTLDITAANEYMWNDGGYSGADFHYDIWDPTVIIADPDPGDGIEICNNPAGLIYRAFIRYRAVDRQETAWADGDPFWGKNWATYFIYKDEPD